MKTKMQIIFLGLAIICQSCSVNLSKRYSNRFNSIYRPSSDPQSFAQVSLGSKNITESVSPTPVYNILSLSAEGQAQLIKSLEAKFPDAKDFVSQLNINFNFIKENKTSVRVISKTIKKEITFTTSRLQYQGKENKTVSFNLAGDRITYLELILKLSENDNVFFNSWDKYDTKYVTLNLGRVSSSQQFNANVTLSAKALAEATIGAIKVGEDLGSQRELVVINSGLNPNTTQNTSELINSLRQTGTSTTGAKAGGELGGSATAGYADKFETSQDLTSRIVDLSGSLSRKQLLLRQEGGNGIDLSGNIKVSLEYTLLDDWARPVRFIKIKEFYSKEGKLIPIKDLQQSFLTIIFPDIKKDVKGKLDYSFLYRQVKHGNRHIPEARHKVTFWHGIVENDSNKVIAANSEFLIEKSDIRPKSFSLYVENNPIFLSGYQPMFETVSEAATFLHYIIELTRIGGTTTTLLVNGETLTNKHAENTLIKTENL